MKILFLVESLRAGGKERRLVSLIKDLIYRENIELEMILFDDEIHYDIPSLPNFRVHIIKRRFKKDILSIYEVCKLGKRLKPDIINPWGVMPAFYSIFLKFFLRKPLLNNQIVDAPTDVKFGVQSLTLLFSDLIISNSKAGLASYNVSEKKSLVIYNGFDFNRLTNLVNPSDIRDEYNLSADIIIGMVASFSIFKDYTTYIKAAEVLLNKYDNIEFLCIGDGDKSDYIQGIKSPYRNKIIFIDKVKDVESLINIFDIGVLSTYTEGTSNAIIEYMALSKPVVSTNGGGTPELVENGKSGFLIEQKNVNQMVEYLELLIIDSEKRKKMGEKGREKVLKKYDYKKMCDSFYNTFVNYSSPFLKN